MTYFETNTVPRHRMMVLLKRLFWFMFGCALFKLLVWYAEVNFGFENLAIDGALVVLGIVIGIIMATQLPFAVSKYKEANDNLDNTRAILWNISNLFIREGVNKKDHKTFVDKTRVWLEAFRGYLKDRSSKPLMIKRFREFSMIFSMLKTKYKFSEPKLAHIDDWLSQLSRFMSGEDSLKTIRTPHALYDVMRIGIFIYVLASALAYPGIPGLIMVLAISFFFGGMYALAIDFDDPFGYSQDEIVDVDIDTPLSDGQFFIDDNFKVKK